MASSTGMNHIQAAEKALEILQSAERTAAHFACEIHWLQERLQIWRARGWRIGVIGITSSGKSTLLNALLRKQLLPSRVGPSSNTLIICTGGPVERAEIHYQDGKVETIESGIEARMRDLGDEANNPGNHLQIREIYLSAPEIMFRRDDVHLVDTPGLDAHGLVEHEKLTLDLFLPTVDLVLFVSDTKANGEGKSKEYLERVSSAGKPCVFVQNKLDAIRPKLGHDGVVIEDIDRIAQKHRIRARALVDGVLGVNLAPVLQVSAKLARNGEPGSSGISALVEALTSRIETLRPRLETGRLHQVSREIQRMTAAHQTSENLATRNRILKAEELLAAKLAKEWRDILVDYRSLADRNKTDSGAKAAGLGENVDSLARTHHRKANELVGNIRDWDYKNYQSLRTMVEACQKQILKLAELLNLREEDFNLEIQPRNVSSVRIDKRTETFERTEEYRTWYTLFICKASMTVNDERTVITDLQKTKDSLKSDIANKHTWFKSAVENVMIHVERRLEPLNAEIDRRRNGIETKRSAFLDEKVKKEICGHLDVLNKQIIELLPSEEEEEKLPDIEVNQETPPVSVQPLDFPLFVPELVRLGGSIHQARLKTLRDGILERAGIALNAQPSGVVWGWDQDALEAVLTLYFDGPGPGPKEAGFPFRPPQGRFGTFAAVVEKGEDVLKGDRSSGGLDFISPPDVLFLILDIESPGATQSQLARSQLQNVLSVETPVVVVLQSVQQYRADGPEALAEAFDESLQRLAELKIHPSGILVNDSNIGLTILMDRLFRHGDELTTQADEMDWLKAIGEKWPSRDWEKIAAQTVREWRTRRPVQNGGER